MMEGIELQYRPSSQHGNRYPLTFNQRLTQGDRYREAAEALEGSLQSIEQYYATPEAGIHTGGPECERCSRKKNGTMAAYYDYYLGEQPGRWDEHLLSYRKELHEMFNSSEGVSLEVIHARSKAELGEHLRRDLCTVLPSDSKEVIAYKMRVDQMLRQAPIEEALQAVFRNKIEGIALAPGLSGRGGVDGTGDHAHPAGFNVRLQETKTAEQRAQLYIEYYCTSMYSDSPVQRNMKMKYQKQFADGVSHDEVLARWRQDARDTKRKELNRLKQRLGELQMAQSAHLKNKKRKMEKDARLKDKEYVVVPRLVECSLSECDIQMDLDKEGPIECAVCDWVARKGDGRRRFYYCSENHVERDFDVHDHEEHGCIMGKNCFFYPMVGPPGDTAACGICPDCAENDGVSFFCSQDCYKHNLEAHRDGVHYDREIESRAEKLHMFSPQPGMEIISS